jgi:hypothetical protein
MTLPLRLATRSAAALILGLGTSTAFAVSASAQTTTPTACSSTTQCITTIAGNGTAGYYGDGGVAVKAELNYPTGVAEDLSGNLYLSDSANNRVRKVVNPTQMNQDIISTVAGNGTGGYAGNGGPATSAELRAPTGTAVASNGNLFVADTANNVVRMVAGSTGTFFGQSMRAGDIYTVAGDNASCWGKTVPPAMTNGVPATSGALCAPTGVAADGHGDFFVSDSGHNIVYIVTPSGAISPYAGTGKCGFSGDGGKGTHAQVCGPTGLALDSSQDLFIADTGNSRVREVTENGNITTIAGNGKFGYSGDGASATKAALNVPTGVGVSSTGDVFISDTFNNRIRKVSGGIITTYAGNGTRGFSGDGGPAVDAELNTPTGSVVQDGTALYFADTGNQRIRGVLNGPPPVLPETALMVLLPIGGALILGGGSVLLIRRRRSTVATA